MPFIFSKNKNIKPLPIIEEIPPLLPKGAKVLDIGTGTGKNALYLAARGFDVDALDSSEETINELQKYIKDTGLSLQASLVDLSQTTPDFYQYNALLFTFIMHYLFKDRGEEVLRTARDNSPSGAIHALAVITTEGDFYRKEGQERKFYVKPGELKETYEKEGWSIISSFEQVRSMQIKNEDGSPMENLVSFLLAQK